MKQVRCTSQKSNKQGMMLGKCRMFRSGALATFSAVEIYLSLIYMLDYIQCRYRTHLQVLIYMHGLKIYHFEFPEYRLTNP